MVKYIKEFHSFVDLMKSIPLTLSITSEDNVKLVLKGEVPYISDKELEEILLFTYKDFSKSLLKSKHARENEIEENLFNLKGNVLRKYFILLKEILSKELKYFRLIKHLKKLQNSNYIELFKEKSSSLTKIQKTNYLCINLFYVNLLDCYECCYDLNDYIIQKEKTLENIQNGNALNHTIHVNDEQKPTHEHIIKTFKSLFKNETTYNSLMEFMKDENLIGGDPSTLIWKGFRSGAKYETASFHEALNNTNLLKKRALDDSELLQIVCNTFKDFKVSERTLRNKEYLKKITLYEEMLKRFKLTLQ